jgi:RNA polymerase-binding transcription factor
VDVEVAEKRKKAVKKKTARKKATRKKTAKKKSSAKKTSTKKTTPKKAAPKKVTKKKATAKKATKKKTTKKRSRQPLKAADRELFKQSLLEKRREIFQNVFEIEGETLKKSRLDASGDLSSMPIHMADIGTDNYEQEFALGLMDSERKILNEIDDALDRIEDGTYGICEGTGEPISKARLKAQPWARYCVEYARMVEEGRIEEQPLI